MKDIYALLNEIDIDVNEYEEMEVSEFEKAKVKRVLKQTINKKKSMKSWKKPVAACCVIIGLGYSSMTIPPVKASIETALNMLLKDKFEKMDNLPSETKFMAVEKYKNGDTLTTYISGKKERDEWQNGNFSISDGKIIASYDKNSNIFLIVKNDGEGYLEAKKMFLELDPSQIKDLGTDTFFNRTVNKYLVQPSDTEKIELWFDKKTDFLVRKIEINPDHTRIESSKITNLDFNADISQSIFDIKAPNGAHVINASNPKSMTKEQKKEYEKYMEKSESNPKFEDE
ncbi:outer membrane lipoprotein carrier protein LolA [Gottfriedia sp. NPDC058432]|uniref:LolA family protein n=1 Tax=Gottfriedia sp. NPDC058432 TaxID=3346497 RepID=UPI003648E2B0